MYIFMLVDWDFSFSYSNTIYRNSLRTEVFWEKKSENAFFPKKLVNKKLKIWKCIFPQKIGESELEWSVLCNIEIAHKILRFSEPTNMTIHWKALEEHFLMVG
jgi:hypothetical protein